MKLETTYICVSDINKSLDFYRQLLNQEPLYVNEDRWITFDCGNFLSLYNAKYDQKLIKENKECFNQAYLDDFSVDERLQNNMVIFNFTVSNLKAEYQRLQELNIGKLSKIYYVNVHHPYYYFNISDPDGNVLEITGNIKEGD